MKKRAFIALLLVGLSGCGQCRLGQRVWHHFAPAPAVVPCVPVQCAPAPAPAPVTQPCPEPALAPTL